ncbi:MAG: DNA repair exonuclease [Clostridiaceae bacterium]|nr:DNA repair exonuclease [Clostridiaceae bacterium]
MVEGIKVLHCADLHLGSELTGAPGSAAQRKQELLGTFRRITNICRDEGVDLLLIAGDMFEGANVDDATVQSVKEYLKNMGSTVAAIAPGNHDYVSIDSPFAGNNWPENVIIFRSDLAKVEFPERGFAVCGAGFTCTYQRESLLEDAGGLMLDSSLINICVLHGDLGPNGAISDYNLVTEAQLAASGFSYVALGHIHKRTAILRTGPCSYSYPGCPDGRGFDELGEKGVYIGTVSKNTARLEFRPVCSRMFLSEAIDISGLNSEGEIVRLVLAELQTRYGSDFGRHYYKLQLTGSIDETFVLPLATIREVLSESLYFVKIADHTHIEVDYEELAKESSLRGIFVRKMLERIAAADRAEHAGRRSQLPIVALDTSGPAADNSERDGVRQITETDKLKRALELGIMSFDGEVKLDEY